MSKFSDIQNAETCVRKAVTEVTVTDIHTHLFPPAHGNLLLWGINELLTYHYLVAELFTVAPRELTYKAFWKLPKQQQADLVWQQVFLKHGAFSEAARGVITTLNLLGLDVGNRKLESIRKWFDSQSVDEYLERVFDIANIDYAVMTNNPFVAEEASHWLANKPCPDCLKRALRIDPLLVDWPSAARNMSEAGYKINQTPNSAGLAESKRFLLDWAERLKPVYMAASLSNYFHYPSDSYDTDVLDEVVLPAARELNLPVALMIGVRKQVNPALGDGGDGVGVADVEAVQHLCQQHSDVKFICTMLSRVNQHELCVLARKFRNLHVEGCWWFCNNPSIMEEMTRMRIELLGTAFTAQHSDGRVLDQVIYKWAHTRTVLANVLVQKYRDQFVAGWRVGEDEIRRDVRALLGGSFEQFCRR